MHAVPERRERYENNINNMSRLFHDNMRFFSVEESNKSNTDRLLRSYPLN